MHFALDGREIQAPDDGSNTLVDLVKQARVHAGGRLVVNVAIDGRELTGDELSAALAREVGSRSRVEFRTADPRELAVEAFQAAREGLSSASDDAGAVAHRINSGDVAGALHDVGRLVNVWRALHQTVIQSGEVCGVDLTRGELESRPVAAHLEDLGARLRELRDALDARDYVLVADFIHYEFPPLCRFWMGACETLAERIASAEPA